MRAILSHLHDRMESEFIKNSVYDLKDGHSSLSLRTRHNVLWFDFMQCNVFDAKMDAVAAGLWAVLCQRVKVPRTSVLDSNGSVRTDGLDRFSFWNGRSCINWTKTRCTRRHGQL